MPEFRPRWHPFLGTDERTPGVWTLADTNGRAYGVVRIVRVGAEVGYVAEFAGSIVGRYRTLRAALEATHQAFIQSHAPGFKGYPKFDYPAPRAED
ncbi:hypothetical protein [Agromyces humatus]|uniref:Uncharacterized protein n=1 Tax=Agromyces humatus TaxID=279573 RepID=A0ABP4X611_9MICO|nr:hypothetical protein [Agromyces humatus]